jgi:hypothetical protein
VEAARFDLERLLVDDLRGRLVDKEADQVAQLAALLADQCGESKGAWREAGLAGRNKGGSDVAAGPNGGLCLPRTICRTRA